MKRKELISLLTIGALMSAVIVAGAVGATTPGSTADPLLSLEWIKSNFIPNTVAKAEKRIEERLTDSSAAPADAPDSEFRLKRGDILTLETGSGFTCLAGSLVADTSVGTLVDVTTGTELAKGQTSLDANHRYLAVESTRASVTVTSDTAVVQVTAPYQLTVSDEVDYYALADALKSLGIFRGTDVPYGSGYELENEPTRIQGLIMFLRLMGEEKAALSWTGGAYTFPDVPGWATPYVGYAYDKGYTKGYGANDQRQVVFGSEDHLEAKDYVTLLLRAMGYAEGTTFNWNTAISDARNVGILTRGEEQLLTEKPFLRAQVAYLSYFGLDAKMAQGGGTLADSLIAKGSIQRSQFVDSRSYLKSQRL